MLPDMYRKESHRQTAKTNQTEVKISTRRHKSAVSKVCISVHGHISIMCCSCHVVVCVFRLRVLNFPKSQFAIPLHRVKRV